MGDGDGRGRWWRRSRGCACIGVWGCADECVRRLEDVNKSCLEEFRQHWECLDNNNQQLWQCRRWERPLNKCVFDNLVCSCPLASFSLHTGLLETALKGESGCERDGRADLVLTEAGEEDSGSARERGPSAPAQETDLRTLDCYTVDGCSAYVQYQAETPSRASGLYCRCLIMNTVNC